MVFRLLDDITVAVHYLVMAYIVFGGFLAWRWRWTIVTHALFICWAVITLVFPWANCPLTLAENYFRHLGGLPQLNGGFIDTYITGVLYPTNDVHLVQIIIALLVLGSWIGFFLLRNRARDAKQHLTKMAG